jgi:molecular chaperone GrpE
MKKEKNSKDEKEHLKVNQIDENDMSTEGSCNSDSSCDCNGECEVDSVTTEIEELKAKLEDKTRQCEEYLNVVQRTAAEFDNYKKRSIKEKEALSLDVSIDTVNTFLPVVDNLERALKAAEEMAKNPLKDGVELVMRQLKECLEKIGVEPIIAVNTTFDPELHNAVMHVTDDENGENVVIEEFQKGYVMKGKVVRHSMVKVVN